MQIHGWKGTIVYKDFFSSRLLGKRGQFAETHLDFNPKLNWIFHQKKFSEFFFKIITFGWNWFPILIWEKIAFNKVMSRLISPLSYSSNPWCACVRAFVLTHVCCSYFHHILRTIQFFILFKFSWKTATNTTNACSRMNSVSNALMSAHILTHARTGIQRTRTHT